MDPYGFKNNLVVFLDHFTNKSTLNLHEFNNRIQAVNETYDFRYLSDTIPDNIIKQQILDKIVNTDIVAYLDEKLYQHVESEEMVFLLDELREFILAVCKKTLLQRGDYRKAWKLNSVRQSCYLGTLTCLEAKRCVEVILAKLSYYSLTAFKAYLQKLIGANYELKGIPASCTQHDV